MDRLRSDLIIASDSLVRLLLRLQAVEGSRPHFDRCTLTVAHLQPSSPWLDACVPNTAISAPIHRIPLALTRLLGMVRQAELPDAIDATLTLQVINGDATEWSSRVLGFAARHGVTLAAVPLDQPRYWTIKDAVLRGK